MTLSRRDLFAATALLGATAALPSFAATAAETFGIKALVFDIQGTVVDYYGPLAEIGAGINQRNGLSIDWAQFAAAWVTEVSGFVGPIVAGQQPWKPIGQIFRLALESVLTREGWAGKLSDADKSELMSVWGKMRPWPDSVTGIIRLKQRFTVAALSNGGMAGIVRVSKNGNLPFDAILTGELAKAYKPAPEVYKLAVDYLGFPPDQIMMVAAHKWDLKGAKAVGFKTAFIPRPTENGAATKLDAGPEPFIDLMAADLIDLAAKLGA